MNDKHGDWTLRSIRCVKPAKPCVSPHYTHLSRLPAASARCTNLDSLLPRALSPRRTPDSLGGGGGQGHNSNLQSTSTSAGQSSTRQSNLAMSRKQAARRVRGKEAVRLGVTVLHAARIHGAWAGYRRATDGRAAQLVLHVEVLYGERCINIDAKKYQALMHKMGEHVQASPSLLISKVLCNVAESLAHHIEIPTLRLGSFEVNAVWLSGRTVVLHVVLYSKLRAGLFPCVLYLVQAVEAAMVCTVH